MDFQDFSFFPFFETDATVFVGSGTPGEERRMLSAEDKIQELTMIVDKQKTDQQKLSRELEEVQAEKVSEKQKGMKI